MKFISLLFALSLAAFIPKSDLQNKPVNNITILKKWKLPSVLKEVSGIAYMGNNKIGCIMDEKGIIFIYDLKSGKIEKEIPFHGSGDFEGIAYAGKTFYAIRSNGILYKISNYNGKSPKAMEYSTWLTVKENTESLCYDKRHNRLLIALKGKDPSSENYKGIYAFNLKTMKLGKDPVYKINLDSTWKSLGGSRIRPSDLAIHPSTGEIYIIDGEDPQLMIMDAKGKLKYRYDLDKKEFELPEGITFSDKGDMYISNEAGTIGKGNILQVAMTD